MQLDIIGDVHGEWPALAALLSALGYQRFDLVEPGEALSHPEGRVPVFLGDLVDRGAASLEVAERVRAWVVAGRAFCLMGNHEYNLVGWWLGVPRFETPKASNRATIADIEARTGRWEPVLAFFRALPISLALPDLRIIHACWHRESLEALGDRLAEPAPENAPLGLGSEGPAAALFGAVVHHSPFVSGGRRPGLPGRLPGQDDPPHAVLLKGFEEPSRPFVDSDGKRRERVRSIWWEGEDPRVLNDRPVVVGHYWNLPPVEGDHVPPHPSGHEDLRAWHRAILERHPEVGAGPLPAHGQRMAREPVVCVDYQGLTLARPDRACVGALRWPEREVVWAIAGRA